MVNILQTERLVLRGWNDDDLEPFYRLNADEEVMRYFPQTLSRAQSDAMAAKIRRKLADEGFGLWAVEYVSDQRFVGFVGLARPGFEAPFLPAMEIGWRLDRDYWGQGLAPEAARRVLTFAFEQLELPEIVSLTAVQNHPSRRVMEKIGLRHHPEDDFEHPKLAPGHPLRKHVLYRLRKEHFRPADK